MSEGSLSPFDLYDLAPLHRRIVLRLLRQGPASAEVLAQAFGKDLAEVRDVLEALVRRGAVRMSDRGQAQVAFGRTRRRTLSARLWSALLATERLYSAQEIATLYTSIPFLQFARARMGEFADHGPGHALRVKSFATQLGYIVGLTRTERHLLRAAALFHDVGNAVDRSRHNIISQRTVEDLAATGELPFSSEEATLVGLLCRWHRGDYDPDRHDSLHGEPIRSGFLASILRVADAMDIDHRRFDYTQRLMRVLELFYPQELPFWTSHQEILGVRICCTPDVVLQVFVQGREQIEKNIQIVMLREDLESTPLDWSIQVTAADEPPAREAWMPAVDGPALVVFPFDPHSLVMAALSCQHLLAAGLAVELLCYPDTPDGALWLWREALPELLPKRFARLVVIGDRADPAAASFRPREVARWRQADVPISLLNRHEANWSSLRDVRQPGVEIILGGDWAYFWGARASRADLSWGRIATLCTRDPTQSVVGLTDEEQAITQGLLKVVYDAISRPAEDTAGWAALAEPILDRIAADDRDFFASRADGFAATWARVATPWQVMGRVLLFEDKPGVLPQSCYWVMEAAIEEQGRTLERGVRFNVPYAIATWRIADEAGHVEDDTVELLAINHWCEEGAIPIRLLYPPDLEPSPVGHESCINLRLPAARAEAVVRALVDACNQSPR